MATALFAATIAVAQNDIKKVLAYSTVSQLGYMFLAVGSGAYTAAIFHMVTHAFFKALLFLGSGAVIHGMHNEQDMRRMGALRKVMPVTAATFIVGWLAIAGVPPFAGFWSKDDILLAAYDKSPVLWALGLITALLTAYYMTRQVIMVFYGEARWHDARRGARRARRHRSRTRARRSCCSRSWCWPVLSIVGGGINLPFSHSTETLATWLEPVRRRAHRQRHRDKVPLGRASPPSIALLGIAASHHGLLQAQGQADRADGARRGLVLRQGRQRRSWAVPGATASRRVAWFDAQRHRRRGQRHRPTWCAAPAQRIRKVQSGNVRNYAAAIGVGVVLLLGLVRRRAGRTCDRDFPILTMLVAACRRSGRSLVARCLQAAARSG